MKHAHGDYVLFVDSDDLLVEGSVPSLLKIAMDTSADLVVADFLKLSDDEILAYHADRNQKFSIQEKTGSELFMQDLRPDQNYVWRTMYRREFLENNHLKFIHGICYEDMPFTPECYLKAKKCVRTTCILYLYRMGHNSITSTMTPKKALDLNKVIARIWELKDMETISQDERQRLLDNLFATFSFELWCISHNPNVLAERKLLSVILKDQSPGFVVLSWDETIACLFIVQIVSQHLFEIAIEMKTVITYGTYGLLHQGHLNLLKRAKALGDYLIVGVTNDNFDRERGKLGVQNNVLERVEAVKATGLADKIIIEDYVGQKRNR